MLSKNWSQILHHLWWDQKHNPHLPEKIIYLCFQSTYVKGPFSPIFYPILANMCAPPLTTCVLCVGWSFQARQNLLVPCWAWCALCPKEGVGYGAVVQACMGTHVERELHTKKSGWRKLRAVVWQGKVSPPVSRHQHTRILVAAPTSVPVFFFKVIFTRSSFLCIYFPRYTFQIQTLQTLLQLDLVRYFPFCILFLFMNKSGPKKMKG